MARQPDRFGIVTHSYLVGNFHSAVFAYAPPPAHTRLTPPSSRRIIPPCRSQKLYAASKAIPLPPATCTSINSRTCIQRAKAPRREMNTSITFPPTARPCFPFTFLLHAIPSTVGKRKRAERLLARKNTRWRK